MGIERNCPIEVCRVADLPTMDLVVKVSELEKLFEALTKECAEWKQSDGVIYWDSPENWLRKQLNLPKAKELMPKELMASGGGKK